MDISYNWVLDLLNKEVDFSEAKEILTSIGLEVEGETVYSSVKGDLEGLIVGKVLSCVRHPNADKLSLTQVDLGTEKVQIVCGAPNVAEGQTVAVATVGATLHPTGGDPFKIKKAKIRGEASFGMICAEDEIGLGVSHDGIMVLSDTWEAGTALSEVIPIIKETILDIGLTPNRGDATSHWGVARDLLAAIRVRKNAVNHLVKPESLKLDLKPLEGWNVIIEDTEACPRYSGILLDKVQVSASPDWLVHRLAALGVNSINNVVDIANYVMLEMGQPLHAFDAEKIAGQQVRVGFLPERTVFLGLDEKERKLKEADLIIKDGDNKAMCIAGVFGGKESETGEGTQKVFLEAAIFNPKSVRATSMHHNLRTNSATIFEKGIDPNNTLEALQRAAFLLKEWAGAEIVPGLIDIKSKEISPVQLDLRLDRINKVLGSEIGVPAIENILASLEMEVQNFSDGCWRITIPPYRTDVIREIDVIEDIVRIYGLDNIPLPKHLKSSIDHSSGTQFHLLRQSLAKSLNGSGWQEIMNVSLTKESYYEGRKDLIKVNNTSNADLSIMRPDMIKPALESLAYNLNRRQSNLKLFEFGKVYWMENQEINETEQLLLLACGSSFDASWARKTVDMDDYDLKGLSKSILDTAGIKTTLAVKTENHDLFETSFEYLNKNNSVIAYGGKLKTGLLEFFEIEKPVYAALINMPDIYSANESKKIRYAEVSKYPTVERHLAIKIKDNIKYGDIQEVIRKRAGKLESEINLFDVYRDDRMIEDQEKSYAISIVFSKVDRTLKDKEINKIMADIIGELERDFLASVRK